jgi:hypothetical protein
MNIGHSSKLQYDKNYYPEHLDESVAPGDYRLQVYSIYNNKSCFAPIGINSGAGGAGVSSIKQYGPAMSQQLVDIESDLSNRGLPQSRARDGRINLKDLTKQKLYNLNECLTDSLSPEYSHLTSTPKNFRDLQINRFYNLHKNPQEPIFYDFAINTTLEAKDNYVPVGPRVLSQTSAYPTEDVVKTQPTCVPIPKRYLD